MNLKRFFFAFAISIGLVACSSDDNTSDGNTDPSGVGNTYVTVSLNLAQSKGLKALPEDYNPDGTYEGIDEADHLDLYMVSADGSIITRRFIQSDLAINGSALTLNEPFRTTSGTKTIYVVVNDPRPLGSTVPNDDDLLDITGLASTSVDGTDNVDLITMSGKAVSVIIEPDVSPEAVKNGANTFNVTVTRLASRVIVTTTASTDLLADNGTKIGTISNITYSVAQGTNKVYFLGKSDFTTWGSAYVPTAADYATQASQYYDYADLSTPSAVPTKPADDGYKSLAGKFLFENTHTNGDIKSSNYKKGNTAYVLVRATLTPEASAIADGGTLTNGTFYVGASDGKIYSTKQAAQTAVSNQKVSVYQEGKMLYYAWLNPDDIAKPLNSPVVRNNIYHVNITGFGKIGLNWNPLHPGEPTDNPDPKPINPDEPTPPIDPTDPLTPEETYMTVDVTVLNWTVHSYDIEF